MSIELGIFSTCLHSHKKGLKSGWNQIQKSLKMIIWVLLSKSKSWMLFASDSLVKLQAQELIINSCLIDFKSEIVQRKKLHKRIKLISRNEPKGLFSWLDANQNPMSTFPSPLSVCEWSRSSWRCRLHRLSLSCYTCPGETWNIKHQNCHNIAQKHDIFVHSVRRGSFFAFLPWTPRWTPHYTPPLSTGPPTPRLGPSLKFCKNFDLRKE